MRKSEDTSLVEVAAGVAGFAVVGCLVALVVAFTVEVVHLIAKYW